MIEIDRLIDETNLTNEEILKILPYFKYRKLGEYAWIVRLDSALALVGKFHGGYHFNIAKNAKGFDLYKFSNGNNISDRIRQVLILRLIFKEYPEETKEIVPSLLFNKPKERFLKFDRALLELQEGPIGERMMNLDKLGLKYLYKDFMKDIKKQGRIYGI